MKLVYDGFPARVIKNKNNTYEYIIKDKYLEELIHCTSEIIDNTFILNISVSNGCYLCCSHCSNAKSAKNPDIHNYNVYYLDLQVNTILFHNKDLHIDNLIINYCNGESTLNWAVLDHIKKLNKKLARIKNNANYEFNIKTMLPDIRKMSNISIPPGYTNLPNYIKSVLDYKKNINPNIRITFNLMTSDNDMRMMLTKDEGLSVGESLELLHSIPSVEETSKYAIDFTILKDCNFDLSFLEKLNRRNDFIINISFIKENSQTRKNKLFIEDKKSYNLQCREIIDNIKNLGYIVTYDERLIEDLDITNKSPQNI